MIPGISNLWRFNSVHVAITCRHGDINEEIRDYVTQKADKLLNYFERVTAIEVTIDFENERVMVEIIVDAEHKHDFVASDSGDEVRTTFDRTLHKMEQQIRRYKEKLHDHRRDKPIAQLSEAAEPEPQEE
jgi:putative sigma-54 modulation protein